MPNMKEYQLKTYGVQKAGKVYENVLSKSFVKTGFAHPVKII